MGSYQKADGITLSQLNNTEYTNFMNRVLTLLTAGSISKLTVTNIVNSIKPKLVQMEDLVNRSTANAETKDLLKLDAERDSYVSYLLATVRAAKNSPLAAQRDAYNTLEITVRPYTGLARMRNMEETAAISGLLLDFRKEAVKTAVTALNLDAILTALETANKNYSALTDADPKRIHYQNIYSCQLFIGFFGHGQHISDIPQLPDTIPQNRQSAMHHTQRKHFRVVYSKGLPHRNFL